jgi:ssRNA-specific RNase YbeY (16S rRNA maturation enzyme)
VLCPLGVAVVWRRPVDQGVLHLRGYDHGADMEAREEELLS